MELLNLNNQLLKVKNIITQNENFLLATHIFPDGDGLGSTIALYFLLTSINKKVIMICNDEVPYQYKFLPDSSSIVQNIDAVGVGSKDKYITICLDTADKKRLRLDYQKLEMLSDKIINIDHHVSNTNFADINIVCPEKSASAEIIYELINVYFKQYLNRCMAICLYTGILTDTGKFQYSNTTSEVHRIISHLLKYDVKPSDIYRKIYENEPYNRFLLLQRALKRVRMVKSIGLVYSYVTQEDFEKLDLPQSAHDGIIEIIRSARDARISVLIREVGKNCFKVCLRSSDSSINVADIAGVFNGGGHVMAAAYTQSGKLNSIISDLIDAVSSRKKNK